MTLLLVLFSFLVILILAYLLYSRFLISASTTPLLAISIILLTQYIFSLFNWLLIGTIIIYFLIIVLFLLYLKRSDKNNLKNSLLSFINSSGLQFFLLFSLLLILFNFVKKPELDYWDELSHWGPFYKSIFYSRKLHIFYDSNLMHPQYLQGLSIFNYFFSWYLKDFYQFMSYISINIFTIAAMSCVFIYIKKIKFIIKLAIMIIYILSFCLFTRLYPFYTLYVDFLLGTLFGAGLMNLFYVAKEKWNREWILIPIITSITLIKETGLILAIFLLAIWFFYIITSSKIRKSNKLHNGIKQYVFISLTILSITIFYSVWNQLLIKYQIKQSLNLNLSSIVNNVHGIIMQSSPFYRMVTANFIEAFISSQPIIVWPIKISMATLFVILSAISFYIFLTHNKVSKKNFNINLILLILPFLCILHIIFTFILIISLFKQYEALLAASFDRYVSTFFVGWLLILYGAVLSHLKINLKYKIYKYISISVLCFTIIIFVVQSKNPNVNFFLIKNFQMNKNIKNEITNKLAILTPILKNGDRIWIISQGDKGIRFWIYHYNLLPNNMVIGNYIPYKKASSIPYVSWSLGPEKYEGDVWSTDISPEDFIISLNYFNIKYIIIDEPDDYLYKSYQRIFSDRLENIKTNQTILYEFNTITKLLDPVNT